jgi:hypothetical protein
MMRHRAQRLFGFSPLASFRYFRQRRVFAAFITPPLRLAVALLPSRFRRFQAFAVLSPLTLSPPLFFFN